MASLKRLMLGALLACLMATPAAAQLNLPATLTYSLNPPTPPTVPAIAEAAALPQFTETMDTTGLVTTTTDPHNYSASEAVNSQSKLRLVCVANDYVAYVDQIKLPNLQPAGHLHGPFFGLQGITKDTTTYYAQRQLATQNAAAGKIVSRCPGDGINGSVYWMPAMLVPNALGDGVTRVKKSNYIVLYYTSDHSENAKNLTRLFPGQKLLFGRNMDDPDMNALHQRVNAANIANPAVQLQWEGGAHGTFTCALTGTQSQSLTNADGTDALGACPSTSEIIMSTDSNTCWKGHLSSVDGYSTTIPAVRSGATGGALCPAEYPYQQLAIETSVHFSHLGPQDYMRWRLSSDDMAATMVGHAVGGGWSLHQDYMFGWHQKFSDIWQCSIGVPIPGKDCTVPHALDYATIGPDTNGNILRLISDSPTPNSGGKPIAPIDQKFSGSKVSDYLSVPAISSNAQRKGGGMIHGM